MRHVRLVLFALILFTLSAFGRVRLPRLISDGMVLQRNAPSKIWGWAGIHEKILVGFRDSLYTTAANDSGSWEVRLSPQKPGGPDVMTISGDDTVNVKDVYIGDVWVCSGQSNMELPMKRVSPIYGSEITSSENASIRCFTVPQKYDFHQPQQDLDSGRWVGANPASVLSFSAAAYFFARELYQTTHVPIGLINTSLGGSPAESWISEDALKAFPSYYKEAQLFKDGALIKKIDNDDKTRIQAWYNQLWQKDEGYRDSHKKWNDTSLDVSGWDKMKIPGYWFTTTLGAVNGVVWFRRDISVPSSMIGQPAKLILGRIVDADSVFVNGKCVGTTSYQYPPRRYEIPTGVLNEGRNTIVVRVISNSGKGGFVMEKPYEIIAGRDTVDLRGEWRYRLGATMEPLGPQTFIRWKPLGLYNAMISPLLNYQVKGAIWYQGESNAGRPAEYRELLATLIRDWRAKWNQGDFPFIFVQLPNFMEIKKEPSESNWALLREAQLKTLALPNTGMAVTIDIGEWNDIHPLNKKDVGKRLALAALNVAYGDKNLVYSGPIYRSMTAKGNRITLSFEHTAGGLIVKRQQGPGAFAIAGADKKFVWAHAAIENDKVVVWSEKVQEPVAVRYAWADNPEGANLYNREGLPASPFRTDDWPSK